MYGQVDRNQIGVCCAAAVVPIDKVPLGSLPAYLAALCCLVVLKNWQSAFARDAVVHDDNADGDMYRTLPALIYVTLLRSARTLDALTDLEFAALIYHAWQDGTCSWNGKHRCHIYFSLLIITSVAASMDYLISLAFALIPAAGRGRQHIALHIVSFSCELTMLTVTALLQRHAYLSDNATEGAPTGSHSLSVQLFLIGSAALTIITFFGNMVGMRTIVRMLRSANRGQPAERPADPAGLTSSKVHPSRQLQ